MKNLIYSGLFVSIGLFLGRLTGFGREAFIAANFGATEQTDLIIVFLSTPDILVNLLVGGALGMALIPEFKQISANSAKRLYQQILIVMIVSFSIFALFMSFYSESILLLLAPGISEDGVRAFSGMFSMTFIAIPLTVASGVTTAFLHHNHKFIVAGLGTLIFNSTLIVSLYMANIIGRESVLYCVSLGVCVGALIRWLSQVINSKTSPFCRFTFSNSLISTSLMKRYFYCVLTGGIIFLLPVVARAIASGSGPGELSLVNYAIKLVEFPLGVVLTVFSIIFFPRFSEIFSQGSQKQFLELFQNVSLCVLALSFAIFVPLHIFSLSIVELVYGWGQLTPDQLDKISSYFQHISFTLPFQGMNALLIAVCASRKDTLFPLLASSFLAFLFMIIGYSLIHEIPDVFNLMIIVYALLTVSLLSILSFRHDISIFTNRDFVLDLLKLLVLLVGFYMFTLQVSYLRFGIFGELLFASCSAALFLIGCTYSSRNIRAMIKINKG